MFVCKSTCFNIDVHKNVQACNKRANQLNNRNCSFFLEDDNKTRELHDKRILLAGLCKLIGYEMFDFKLAAPIFAQLIRVSDLTI